LDQEEETYPMLQGLYASTDTGSILGSSLVNWYLGWFKTRTWGADTKVIRTTQMQEWLAMDPSLPVFDSTVDLLEYALNNLDLVDILHSLDQKTSFEVRTEFLNAYPHKDATSPVGAVIGLEVQESGLFVIRSLSYAGTLYPRAQIPERIASVTVLGVFAYVTVATHAFHLHYSSSARVASLSASLLSMTHPVRQILMPTELGVTNSIARGVHALLGEDRFFVQTLPFTYEGLRTMLQEYVPVMTFPPVTHRIGSDYHQWWTYLDQQMSRVVEALYPPGTTLDPAVRSWLTALHEEADRAGLVRVLVSGFMIQVRHNFVSNRIFGHFARFMLILDPREVPVTTAFRTLLVSEGTTLRWVPMTRNFSENVDHPAARSVMQAFYTGMKDLQVQHPLAQPQEIEASTGM